MPGWGLSAEFVEHLGFAGDGVVRWEVIERGLAG